MKRNYFFLASLLLCEIVVAQNDTWTQVVGNGFGTVSQNNISAIDTFESKIYVGTLAQNGSGPLQIWKSTTGNSGSFTKVNNYTPALNNEDIGVTAIAHTNLTPGYMYLAAENKVAGAVMYRSSDGSAWKKISKRGMGNVNNTRFCANPVITNIGGATHYLYVGTSDTVSVESASIWRIEYNNQDSTQWVRVFDFSTVDITVKNVTWMYVYSGKIYACTDGTAGHLYESTDGTTWTKNTAAGVGFGVASNKHIASLASYNGYLFATTHNETTGGQLWKTSDGTTWTQVTGNAFGQGAAIDELRRVAFLNGLLWATGQRLTGTAMADLVWRSDDGINFTQSNTAGFGDSNNNSGFPCIGGFNGNIYHGIANNVTGAQLWRTSVGIPIASFELGKPNICQYGTRAFTNTSQAAVSFEWQLNGMTFDTNQNPSPYTFNVPGTFTISLIAINGSISDTANATITVHLAPTITADASPNTVCNGQSTTLSASGGNAGSYVWSNGATTSSITVSPVTTATYVVTGAGIDGCTNTARISITVHALPIANAGTDANVCTGGSVQLNATGGTSYAWSPSTGLSSNTGATPVASPTSNTTYTVTVTQNGCSATDIINVTVVGSLTANAGSDISICFGNNITLSGSGGGNYTWTPTTGLSNPNVGNPVAMPSTTTTYTMMVSSGACSSMDIIVVTVNPLPVVTITTYTTVGDCTPSFTLTGNPGGGFFSGTGVTGNSFNPSTAGIGTHVITYDYTDINTCSNSTTTFIVVTSCSGISETSLLNTLNLFPNPTDRLINVRLTSDDTFVIRLMSMNGQMIDQEQFNYRGEFNKTYDLNGYARGIYYLKLINSKGSITKKIVVE